MGARLTISAKLASGLNVFPIGCVVLWHDDRRRYLSTEQQICEEYIWLACLPQSQMLEELLLHMALWESALFDASYVGEIIGQPMSDSPRPWLAGPCRALLWTGYYGQSL